MTNRVLKRQIKKFLGLNDDIELLHALTFLQTTLGSAPTVPGEVRSLVNGLDDFFQAVDRGYAEYDRVLRSRETSLEIGEAELSRVNAEIRSVQAVLEDDLRTAAVIQQTLIPGPDLDKKPGLRLASWFQSATQCGGDWWGQYQLADGRTLVLIGDITGHGTGSALLSAVVKGYCDSVVSRSDFELRSFFVELNNQISRLSQLTDRCMSMLGVVYDDKAHTLEMVNAGHPLPFLIHTADQTKMQEMPMELNGPLLGSARAGFDPEDLRQAEFRMNPGDKLILFTDGVTESVNTSGDMFSEHRLQRQLLKLPVAKTAFEWRDLIRQQHAAFRQSAPLVDDITLIVAECL